MLFDALPPHILPQKVQVLIFDKDNTITPASQPLEPSMAEMLADLSQDVLIVLLTARDFSICEKEIIAPLERFSYKRENIIFGCCNGAEIFCWDATLGQFARKSVLSGEMDPSVWDEARARMNHILGRDDVSYERRGDTMVTFVCLRRDASPQERQAFDPDKTRRITCIEAVRDIFPDSYELVAGGSTSIDIALYNKAAGIAHIRDTF